MIIYSKDYMPLWNMRNFKILFAISIFLCVHILHAQINSPYSISGLGDNVASDNIINRAMGGTSIANYNQYSNNVFNPASYGARAFNANGKIIFDIGIDIKSQTLQDNFLKQTTNSNIGISYLNLGFPISKTMGMVFGFQPINFVGYELSRGMKNSVLDTFVNVKRGDGGAYNIFVGWGHKIKKFSYGFNIGYISGLRVDQNIIQPIGAINAKSVNYQSFLNYHGLLLQYGLLYTLVLDNDPNKQTGLLLHLGANGNIPINLNATSKDVVNNFVTASTGALTPIDTSFYKATNGILKYPTTTGIGFTLENINKWKIAFDYVYFNKMALSIPNNTQQLGNESTIKAGLEFVPNYKSSSYLAQIPYRFGIRVGNNTVLNNQSIPAFSLSAGIGLWIKRFSYILQTSIINVSVEYQRRGVASLFYDNYYNLSIGFSLSDIWFRKSKFY